MNSKGRNIVLFGPPGVGKGAQAELLSHGFGVGHLSTGEIIREEIHRESELGKRVKDAVARGAFADDETVLEIVMARIDRPEFQAGFVMDGFPRNVTQAKRLDQLLAERGRKVDHALFIVAPESTVLERLAGRLVCSRCGRTFHRQFRPPRIAGICDACKGKVQSRHDDDPEVHRERLRAYHDQTEPLAKYYEGQGVLSKIDGDQSIEEVAADVRRTVGRER